MVFGAEYILVLLCSLFCFESTPEEDDEVVSRTYIREGEDAVLHCSSENSESLENSVVQWKNEDGDDVTLYEYGHHSERDSSVQYRGRASLYYHELSNGNASMVLRATRAEDTGTYTCSLSLGPRRSRTRLIVGAVHGPYLQILNVSEAGVELQCVVRGSSSAPSVAWQTCDGLSLEGTHSHTVCDPRGRYNTTLLVTVAETTKTTCFRCVVQQEDISHRIVEEIIVPETLGTVVHGGPWVFVVTAVLLLVLLALGLSLGLSLSIKKCRSRRKLRNRREEVEEEMMKFNASDQNNEGQIDMRKGTVKEGETRLINTSDDDDITLQS